MFVTLVLCYVGIISIYYPLKSIYHYKSQNITLANKQFEKLGNRLFLALFVLIFYALIKNS